MKENFSLWDEAQRLAQSFPVEDLGPVTYVSRCDFEERETFTFLSSAPCLEYLSLLIENALLLRTNRAGRVYAGFEKLSRMEGIVDRYLRIADVSERVYVFGEADWKPPRHPNMRVIALQRDARLAHECFVIANSSSLRTALVAFAEDEASGMETKKYRVFKTSNPSITDALTSVVEEFVNISLAA